MLVLWLVSRVETTRPRRRGLHGNTYCCLTISGASSPGFVVNTTSRTALLTHSSSWRDKGPHASIAHGGTHANAQGKNKILPAFITSFDHRSTPTVSLSLILTSASHVLESPNVAALARALLLAAAAASESPPYLASPPLVLDSPAPLPPSSFFSSALSPWAAF